MKKKLNRVIALSLGMLVASPVLADSPKSCKDIKKKNNSSLSGNYIIDPDGNGGNGPFEVYCDMASGNVGLTFYLVTGGLTTGKVTDNDSCQELGLKIFAPRTEEDYDRARQYLLSIGAQDKFGPLGVYHPTHNQTWYCAGCWTSYTPMNSDHAGTQFGWTSTAGDTWWISDSSAISEPNGDYTAGAWLWIGYDGTGNVNWYNDGNGGYSYSTYLCMSEDNYATVSDDDGVCIAPLDIGGEGCYQYKTQAWCTANEGTWHPELSCKADFPELPLSVTINSFSATRNGNGKVKIKLITGSETETAALHIYRAPAILQNLQQIQNICSWDGAGTEVSGSVYSCKDENAPANVVYWPAEVENNGVANHYLEFMTNGQ
jgi:hypothetical protein